MSSICKNIPTFGLLFLVACASTKDRLANIAEKCRSQGHFCSTSYLEKKTSSDSKIETSIVEIFFTSQKPGKKCHKTLSTHELENPEIVTFPKSESDMVEGWQCDIVNPRVPQKSPTDGSRGSKLLECMAIKDNSESKKCLEAETKTHE